MSHRIIPGPIKLLGCGSALPGPPVDNAGLAARLHDRFGLDLARRVSLINTLLGVEARHTARAALEPVETAEPGCSNPELAARALRQALEMAGLSPGDMGYLLGHTTTPHTLLPPNAAWLADELGYAGPFTELRQACTGFAAATQLAAGLLALPGAEPVGVVGSETGSLFIKFSPEFLDREQTVNLLQMGDGAGAVVLGPDDGRPGGSISHMYFGSLGLERAPGFSLSGGGSADPFPADGCIRFAHDYAGVREHGPELFRAGLDAAAGAGVDMDSVDWFLPHQVNGRLAVQLAGELGLPMERIVVEADQLGNLGSAAIWVSLDRLIRSGRLDKGGSVLVLGAEATKYLYGGFLYRH